MTVINPTTDRTLNATLNAQGYADTFTLTVTDRVERVAVGTDLTVEEARALQSALTTFLANH